MNLRQMIADEKHRLSQESDLLNDSMARGHEVFGQTREAFAEAIDRESQRLIRSWDALRKFEADMKAQGYL